MFLEFEQEQNLMWYVQSNVASPITCFLQETRFNTGIMGTGLISGPVSILAQRGALELPAYVISGVIRTQEMVMIVEQSSTTYR